MKRATLFRGVICVLTLGSIQLLGAQEVKLNEKKEVKVVKRTVMEQYEPGMILTANDRIRLKKERNALLQKRRSIIDTLDISERRKRSLLKELYSTPYSHKWDKVIADLELEDNDAY